MILTNLITLKYSGSQIRKRVMLGLLFLVGLQAVGQNDYSLFKSYEPFRPDSTGIFYIAVDNANFFKNNEYKSDFATGYTLTGAWLRPKLVYYPDKKLRMEFGGYVVKYNGRDKYDHLSPWFNVHYQPTEKIAVIVGNLNADQNHNLPEPIADPERFLTAKPEAGLQVKYNASRFSTDLWIDWQQFIQKGDPFKERFAFGVVANWKIFEKDNASLSIPLIFYGLHQGGEIDTAPGLAASFISVTPGLTFKKRLSSRTFKGWNLNTSFSQSSYPKDDVVFTESKGWGFYVNGGIGSRFGGLSAAYWHSHQFYIPQGGIIYQNLSKTGSQMIPENKLVNLKYHFEHEIMPNTSFSFIFDYYYDTINKKTMNSEGVYLIVNFGVKTKRVHRESSRGISMSL